MTTEYTQFLIVFNQKVFHDIKKYFEDVHLCCKNLTRDHACANKDHSCVKKLILNCPHTQALNFQNFWNYIEKQNEVVYWKKTISKYVIEIWSKNLPSGHKSHVFLHFFWVPFFLHPFPFFFFFSFKHFFWLSLSLQALFYPIAIWLFEANGSALLGVASDSTFLIW